MNISEPFYLITANRYLLDTESPTLEKTPPYDFHFPFSKWAEMLNAEIFLGKREEFFDKWEITKTIFNLFPPDSMRN